MNGWPILQLWEGVYLMLDVVKFVIAAKNPWCLLQLQLFGTGHEICRNVVLFSNGLREWHRIKREAITEVQGK